MRAESTKKAITAAYELHIGRAYDHLVEALATAGEVEADRRAAGERFQHSIRLAQDAYARALDLIEG